MKDEVGLKEINKLCALSAFEFSDSEKQELIREVNGIVRMLQECDEVVVDEMADKATKTLSELRDDTPSQSLTNETALLNAPKSRKRCFNVPKVVD